MLIFPHEAAQLRYLALALHPLAQLSTLLTPQLFQPLLPFATALMRVKHSHVNELKEATTIADHTTYAYHNIRSEEGIGWAVLGVLGVRPV